MPDGFDRHVKSAADCIELLKSGAVTQISLDHDLGPPEAGTGYDVAKYIERAAFDKQLPRLDWALHTANSVGRRSMRAALTNATAFWAASSAVPE